MSRDQTQPPDWLAFSQGLPPPPLDGVAGEEKVGRMRDTRSSLATRSEAVGLGDKQAVARKKRDGEFAPQGLLIPHLFLLGVV